MTEQEQIVFWHRELPPLEGVVSGEYAVEAQSEKIALHGHSEEEKREMCRDPLLAIARHRIEQEVARLNGWCAHVVDEQITPRVNEATQEYWLTGRFIYVLYRKPPA